MKSVEYGLPQKGALTESLALLDDVLWKIAWDARPSTRGKLHAAAAVVAPPAAAALVAAARPGPVRWATGVYAAGLCAMFAASGTYHRVSRSRKMAERLRRLDHSMIYAHIAGTWTPIAVAVLPRRTAGYVLGGVWGAALSAISAKVIWLNTERRAGSWFYPVLGLAGAGLAGKVKSHGGRGALMGLVLGGISYISGMIVFALQRPNPSPRHFGHHEIFHVAVVGGVAAHFATIYRLVRRR